MTGKIIYYVSEYTSRSLDSWIEAVFSRQDSSTGTLEAPSIAKYFKQTTEHAILEPCGS